MKKFILSVVVLLGASAAFAESYNVEFKPCSWDGQHLCADTYLPEGRKEIQVEVGDVLFDQIQAQISPQSGRTLAMTIQGRITNKQRFIGGISTILHVDSINPVSNARELQTSAPPVYGTYSVEFKYCSNNPSSICADVYLPSAGGGNHAEEMSIDVGSAAVGDQIRHLIIPQSGRSLTTQVQAVINNGTILIQSLGEGERVRGLQTNSGAPSDFCKIIIQKNGEN